MGNNILTAARNNEISRLINLGSSCMYPKNKDTPLMKVTFFLVFLNQLMKAMR